MKRPNESFKGFANDVARQISTRAGVSTAYALRMLHEAQAESPSGTTAHWRRVDPNRPEYGHELPETGRVGIWQRRSLNGEDIFVRDEPAMHERLLWADVGRIPAKSTNRRVVFLGESVARGILYDPAYNPAMVLERIFDSFMGQGAVEVVDLARISIEMEIREVAIAAAALQPDIVVLFCGNNWRYTHPYHALGLGVMAATLADRGIVGLKEQAEAILQERAEQVVDEISAFYAARGIPVLWIAPEFNLGEWRDPVTSAPHLPGDRNRQWLDLQARAHAALTAGNREGAAKAALQMIDVDQGTSAASYYILAECGADSDGSEDVRTALEAARDASANWDMTVPLTPRISSTVRTVLRERAQARGDLFVDSADLFRNYLHGEIPGRRMFLDYCHLTSEGIRVTMAAVASALFEVFGLKAPTWREVLPAAPTPSADVESEAYFMAAIHNAHCWQGSAIVEHCITQSLKFSTHLVPIMTAFVEQQSRRIPLKLSRAAETIFESGSEQIQRYLFRREHSCLDPTICAAIIKGLRGIDVEPVPCLERLWRQEHKSEDGPLNLLEYYYLSAARQPYEAGWVLPGFQSQYRDYYKAFSPVSKFCFIGEAHHTVILHATWRIPHLAKIEESVQLRLNGHPIGALLGGTSWSCHEITLPESIICDGLNEIVFEWPIPDFPGRAAILAASDALASTATPDMYCSFGDVCALTVSS